MNIATIRTGLGLTQAQFAGALGVSEDYIGHLEQGVRKPSIKLAARIERLANIVGLVDHVIAAKVAEARA